MSHKRKLLTVLAILVLGTWALHAQNPAPLGSTPVQVTSAYYPLTPISATAGSGAATTLTLPAPVQSGYYNYVCYLAMQGGNDNSAGVVTNATGSSTNFNSWANKISNAGASSSETGVLVYLRTPYPACVKSQSPTTATTFVSPNSTHQQYTWYALYFQAP